jgi:hypothetical protein
LHLLFSLPETKSNSSGSQNLYKFIEKFVTFSWYKTLSLMWQWFDKSTTSEFCLPVTVLLAWRKRLSSS